MSDMPTPGKSLLPKTIDCPECKLPTFRLKCMKVSETEHYGIAHVTKTKNVIGCPLCMRKILGTHHFGRLFTEIYIFPVVLVQWLLQYLSTYTAGHSRAAGQILRGETDAGKLDFEISDPLQGAALLGGVLTLVGMPVAILLGALAEKNLPVGKGSWDADMNGDLGSAGGLAALASMLAVLGGPSVWHSIRDGMLRPRSPTSESRGQELDHGHPNRPHDPSQFRPFLRTTIVAFLGAAIWMSLRLWGDTRFEWGLGGRVFCWSIGGAIVACLSASQIGAWVGGREIEYPESGSAGTGWGPRLAGAIGGAISGSLCGVLLGLFSGDLLGVAVGWFSGAFVGALGGFLGGSAAAKGR